MTLEYTLPTLYKNSNNEILPLEHLTEKEKKALNMTDLKGYKEDLKSNIKNNTTEIMYLLKKVTNISEKEAEREINMILEEKMDNDIDKNIISIASKEEIDNARNVYMKILIEEVKKNISIFFKKEQEILIMRFGLNNGVRHTLEETGEKFGITREKIRQIEGRVFEIMKKDASLNKKMWVFKQ